MTATHGDARPWYPQPAIVGLDEALAGVSTRVRSPPLTGANGGPAQPSTVKRGARSVRGTKPSALTLRALTLTEAPSPWDKANESSGQREAHPSQSFSTVKQSNQGCALWVPDEDAPFCMQCGSSFTWRLRRHHCRFCGRVVCATCSQYRLAVPVKLSAELPSRERACRACHQSHLRRRQFGCNGACGQAKRYCLLDALASHILLEHPSCPVQPLPPSQEFADSEPASRTVGHIESWRSSPSPPSNISGLGLRRRGTCSRILDGDPQTLELPILQAFLQWTIARHRARKALVHGSAAAEEMASEGL